MTIEEAVASNISIAGTIRSIGRAIVGSNYKWVKKEVDRLNLDISHWRGRAHGTTPQHKHPTETIFIENSKISRGVAKKRIIKDRLIPYKCSRCQCEPVWMDERLVFVLDHINGVRNDHRLENLRFLCPNCNSQGDTFAGRNLLNRPRKEPKRCACGRVSPSGKCRSCTQLERLPLHNWPPIEILCQHIYDTSFVKVAREIGLTDSGVKGYISRKLKIPRNQVSEYIKCICSSVGRTGDSKSSCVEGSIPSRCTTFK